MCVLAGAKLMSLTDSSAAGNHPASLRGAKHAPLGPASGRRGNSNHGAAKNADPIRTPSPSATPGTPTPTSTPSSTPSAPTSLTAVSGKSVTAVGDSVMVAATPALDDALPGIYIDAQVGRQFSTGLDVISTLKSEGLLRSIVVVGLGTNGTVTSDEVSELYSEIGPSRRLVLVNTYEDRSWEQEVNSTLSGAVSSHSSSTVLADWYDTIAHQTSLLWPDGIHPQPAGGIVYAKMLKTALEKVAGLSG
ncbi:MAG TPA: hypothetical protein VGM14_06630 [Streptosporangiaceae bacterium]|jgi:hypothetical protein